MKRINKIYFILTLIILLGLFFRLVGINSESYWLDEAISVKRAQEPYLKGIEVVKTDTHLPLHIIILHGWVQLFGISEISTRLLSTIFDLISIYVIFILGRRLFDYEIGLISALLLSISSLAIYYSQEARPYSLFMLLTLLSFYFYIKLLKVKNIKNIILYSFFTLLLVYTHHFSFFVLLIQNIYYILLYRKKLQSLIHWFAIQSVLGLLFLPWVPILIKQISDTRLYSWIPKPTIFSVLITFDIFFNNTYSILILILIVLIILIGKNKIKNELNKLSFILMWAFIPFIIVIPFSLIFRSLYHMRYFIFTLPAFYLFFAWCVSKVSNNILIKRWLITIIIVSSIPSILYQYKHVDKDDWRSISLFIKDNIKDDTYIFIHPYYQQEPFTLYFDKECFEGYYIYSCNFNKHNILSLNSQAKCCDDSTILTSTNNYNQLGYYLDKEILLINTRDSIYYSNDSLFDYFSTRKELILTKEFEMGVKVYKFK